MKNSLQRYKYFLKLCYKTYKILFDLTFFKISRREIRKKEWGIVKSGSGTRGKFRGAELSGCRSIPGRWNWRELTQNYLLINILYAKRRSVRDTYKRERRRNEDKCEVFCGSLLRECDTH